MMNNKWKGIVTDEELRHLKLGSHKFIEKLSELIEREIDQIDRNDNYDNVNWQLERAEANGKRKFAELILKLIKE